jgi:hypothetical protein
MAEPELQSAEAEHQHHRYIGSHIPWYVHLIWLTFWGIAFYYVFRYVFPAIQTELLSPP